MKRIRAGLLALLLLCTLCPTVSASQDALTLDVSDAIVFAGDTLRVTLSLADPLPDVGSLEVHLLYDTDALEVRSLTTGEANDALRSIEPSASRPYTGVLFAYDYGTDVHADKAFRAGTLLTAEFAVREGAVSGTLRFACDCAAAFDTAFSPLSLAMPSAAVSLRDKPSVSIRNGVPSLSVGYRATVTLHADVTNPVPDAEIRWFVADTEAHTGDTLTLSQLRADVAVRAEYVSDGRTLSVSDTETVHVETGFFAKLIAFFRALFGALPHIIQSL